MGIRIINYETIVSTKQCFSPAHIVYISIQICLFLVLYFEFYFIFKNKMTKLIKKFNFK